MVVKLLFLGGHRPWHNARGGSPDAEDRPHHRLIGVVNRIVDEGDPENAFC